MSSVGAVLAPAAESRALAHAPHRHELMLGAPLWTDCFSFHASFTNTSGWDVCYELRPASHPVVSSVLQS